jgi:hypothetical protein
MHDNKTEFMNTPYFMPCIFIDFYGKQVPFNESFILTGNEIITRNIPLDARYIFQWYPLRTHPTEGEYLPCRLEPGRDGPFSLARRAGEDWWESDSGLTITGVGLAGDGSCRGSLPGRPPVQLKRHTLYSKASKHRKANCFMVWPPSGKAKTKMYASRNISQSFYSDRETISQRLF